MNNNNLLDALRFPKFFQCVSATGKTLSLERLFRFQGYDGTDYMVAMELKRMPYDNLDRSDWIEVFDGQLRRIHPEEEDVYYLARTRYEQWRGAHYYIKKYLEAVDNAFPDAPWLPDALEELEIKLLSRFDARQAAELLLESFEKRKKFIQAIHGAMCAILDDETVRQLADQMAYYMLVDLTRLERAKAELYALAQKLCR
jgi:hypothetical protein